MALDTSISGQRMTASQRAERVVDLFEQTTMGWLGGKRDSDPNILTARVGVLYAAIREEILEAEGAARGA